MIILISGEISTLLLVFLIHPNPRPTSETHTSNNDGEFVLFLCDTTVLSSISFFDTSRLNTSASSAKKYPVEQVSNDLKSVNLIANMFISGIIYKFELSSFLEKLFSYVYRFYLSNFFYHYWLFSTKSVKLPLYLPIIQSLFAL